MKIVIEGVETAEQLALLSEHHCADLVQGYVFSRPVPNSAIITLAQALESPKDQATSKVA
jgi:EAL domain-containing protein (putative c-di-GMP-specific phosphodiesterase class I)